MAAYNRFVVMPEAFEPSQDSETALTLALQISFETGFVLNRFVFASWPGDKPVHPFPEQQAPWSVEDSDLNNAVVIALAAGGRSCRAFVQQLATNRAPNSGPSGLVEITSLQVSGIDSTHAAFPHQVLKYDEALSADLTQWVMARNPRRIVITDFGGRDNIVEPLEQHLRTGLPHVKLDIIGVGREAQFKPGPAAIGQKSSGVRMNTSGIRVEGIKQLGEAQYFQQAENVFHEMIQSERERCAGTSQDGQVLGVKIEMRDGIRGDKGFEQAWNDLCAGRLSGKQALVFRI